MKSCTTRGGLGGQVMYLVTRSKFQGEFISCKRKALSNGGVEGVEAGFIRFVLSLINIYTINMRLIQRCTKQI